MPRHAAISRTAAAPAPGTSGATSTPSSHPAPQAPAAPDTVTLALSPDGTLSAWNALVQRCGSAQAAFEALVLLPAALEAAGIDPCLYMRCRQSR